MNLHAVQLARRAGVLSEEAAAVQIANECAGVMARTAMSVLHNQHDAEEVVTDTLRVLVRRFLDGDQTIVSDPKAFARLCAYNKALEKAKKVKAYRDALVPLVHADEAHDGHGVDGAGIVSPSDSPEVKLVRREAEAAASSTVGELLARLSVQAREIIIIIELHELDFKTAAKRLNVKEDTLRRRHHRAMMALRKVAKADDRWRALWKNDPQSGAAL